MLLVAVWQVPRIRVRLSGDYSKDRLDAEESSWIKHWGRLFVGLLLFLVIGIMAEGWLWSNKNYEMPYYNFEARKDGVKLQPLPLNYSLKKPLWQLGITPLPTWVEIPAGEFKMGSDKGGSNEKPVHTVKITAFSMSQHETTFEQYDYFVWKMRQANIKQVIDGKEMEYRYPFDESWGRGKQPVINVSWNDAQAYTNWVSKEISQTCRLPSEAEWEYAARAGTETAYPWGDDVGKNNANCNGCGSEWDAKQTAPVGSFNPNSFGLNDMHGNVWEWVQDLYHDRYQGAPANGEAWEGNDGPRVLRGGSWYYTPGFLRSAYRNGSVPVYRDLYIGFRIVCSSH